MAKRTMSGIVIGLALLGAGMSASAVPALAAGNHPASYPCAQQPNQPQCKTNAPSVVTQGNVVAAGTGVTTSGAVSTLPTTGGGIPAPDGALPGAVLGLLFFGLGASFRRWSWKRR